MRLTIVGCAGSYPNPAGPASCYLVEHDGFRMVLDLGSGALGPLQRYVDPAELDAVRGWLGGKASTIYGGSQEVQNNIISKRILGLPDPAATR